MKDVPLLPALPLGLVVGPGAPGHEVAGQCRRSPLSRCTKSWPPRHQLWDSWCPGPESPQRSGVLHRKRGGKRPGLLGLRGLFLGCPPQPLLKMTPYKYLAPTACWASRRGPRWLPFPPCHPHVRGGRASPEIPDTKKEESKKYQAVSNSTADPLALTTCAPCTALE